MELSYLIKGLLIGLSIAAPVGPIGVLCIRRTLAQGRLSGLVTGLGAASADAIYGFIAGFGLTAVSAFLIDQQVLIRIVGGLFLCYLGIKTLLSRPGETSLQVASHGLLGDFGSTFFLTLTNPLTIISFAAVFAGLGLAASTGSYASAMVLVIGVFLGSAAWWLLLSFGVGFFSSRLQTGSLLWVNRISGLLILAFGMAAVLSVFKIVA